VQGAFVCRELDRIRVKGRSQPVAIYELMSFLPDFAKHADRLARYEAALAAYREHDWVQAVGLFEDVLEHYPDDGPSQLLLERCVEFRSESPTEDWDGVYVMKTK
jgi:adenylate cyclase